MLKGDDIVHLDVFERDNWTCHLCGDAIDPRLRGDNWWRATLDHLLPLSKGGSHTLDNVASAHWRCNMDRGDTLLPTWIDYPGLTG